MLLAGMYWHLDYLKVFNTTFVCYQAVTTRLYFAATQTQFSTTVTNII